MVELSMVEAVQLALARAMAEDETILILGEDVGVNGGVFRATEGLQERFGGARVFDTPLSEALLGGLAVGLGAQGFRPIVEFQFMGFIYPAVDQVVSHAGRLRNRTRGRLTCPIVLRAPFGGGIHAPEHHSESTEAMFAHIPGIRVVIPSSPARAYGLLLAAIREPDPVVFLEPKRIYRAPKEEVADDGSALALDSCFRLRDGNDITLVTWGALVTDVLAVADQRPEHLLEPLARKGARRRLFLFHRRAPDVYPGMLSFPGRRLQTTVSSTARTPGWKRSESLGASPLAAAQSRPEPLLRRHPARRRHAGDRALDAADRPRARRVPGHA